MSEDGTMRFLTDGGTWHEKGNVAIEVEDTDVGREVSIYDLSGGEATRRYTMPAGDARELRDVLNEVFPADE